MEEANMKVVTIWFQDSVDLSAFPAGKEGVSISDGTTTVNHGKVLIDPFRVVDDHKHPIPPGETGPPITA